MSCYVMFCNVMSYHVVKLFDDTFTFSYYNANTCDSFDDLDTLNYMNKKLLT